MNPDINIEKAIDSANPKLLSVSVSLPEKIPEILKKNNIRLKEIDQQTIANTLSDVLLGIIPVKMSVDAIIDNAIDYEDIADALGVVYKEVFSGLESELKTYPINTDPGSQIFIENMFSQMPTIGNAIGIQKLSTAQILSGGDEHPIEDVPHADPKQVLNEIENPTPTVAKPDFVLPKSKPSTADILKGIAPSTASAASTPTATSTPAPATIAPSFAADLDLSTNTDGIIDPFKNEATANMPTSAAMPAAGSFIPSSAMPATQAQSAISEIMGTKLNDMTGAAPKESFKIMPLSETMKNLTENNATGQTPSATASAASNASKARPVDPYREPIE